MPERIYRVERELPGVTPERFLLAQAALERACRRLTEAGEPVTYLGTVWSDPPKRMVCRFKAASREGVRRANDAAQVPYGRIC